MYAFISSLPLSVFSRTCWSPSRIIKPHRRSCCDTDKVRILVLAENQEENYDNADATLSMDTLPSFEALCWRAQRALCEEAEAADGLGTFSDTPMTANPAGLKWRHRQERRQMSGGRAFSYATVDVVRNSAKPSGQHRHDDEPRQSVGVTLNLHPRIVSLPRLRAAVHYFQIGHLAWWFTGSVDLSAGLVAHGQKQRQDDSDILLNEVSRPFINTWTKLCNQYRIKDGELKRESTLAFLTGCFNYDVVESRDRDVSFRFASDVVDAFLPSYLPLLAGKGSGESSSRSARRNLKGSDFPTAWTSLFDMPPQFTRSSRQEMMNKPTIDLFGYNEESAELFSLESGALCESVMLSSPHLNSWRFSLSPSQLSSAGRVYSSLRDLAHVQPSASQLHFNHDG